MSTYRDRPTAYCRHFILSKHMLCVPLTFKFNLFCFTKCNRVREIDCCAFCDHVSNRLTCILNAQTTINEKYSERSLLHYKWTNQYSTSFSVDTPTATVTAVEELLEILTPWCSCRWHTQSTSIPDTHLHIQFTTMLQSVNMFAAFIINFSRALGHYWSVDLLICYYWRNYLVLI